MQTVLKKKKFLVVRLENVKSTRWFFFNLFQLLLTEYIESENLEETSQQYYKFSLR